MASLLSQSQFIYVAIVVCPLWLACSKQKDTQFTKLDPSQSGIRFVNSIEETAEMNILTYEYLYNGGGVAAADFNNDGWCDLYFTGNAVSNKLYLNRKNLRFEDITSHAGVSGRSMWKTGVTIADINGDGWLDMYVCYAGKDTTQNLSNELYINNGADANGTVSFSEKAKEYGLDAPDTFSTQAAFFDYDKDGDMDMFLVNHGNHFYSPFINTHTLRNMRHPNFGNRLYRHDINTQPGKEQHTFTEVSTVAGIHGGGINFSLGVAISDFNDDGWPDIYVTNDYEEQDFFYINKGDGTFTETSKKSFGHFSRNGMGVDAADFNNDGRMDLIEVDMWPEDNYRQKLLKGPDDYNRYHLMLDSGFHHQLMRNTLQLNQHTTDLAIPLFSEIGQMAGVSSTDWSWAPLLADFDNDGHKDLFVTNGYLRDFTSLDFLKYTVEDAKKEAAKKGERLELFQLIRKMTATRSSDYLFKNNGNLTFSNVTQAWGLNEPNLSFGATYADLDNDGDLEIITNNTNEVAKIWLNNQNTNNQTHSISIQLTNYPINTFAIGAKIFLQSEGVRQLQEIALTRGFQSSVPPIVHFGVGKNAKTCTAQVIWPDGKMTTKQIQHTDQLIQIAYSDPDPTPSEKKETLFNLKEITQQSGIDFTHHENPFIDFDREPLIPYQMSQTGPALAVADVNADGYDDFYVGGAADQESVLFIGRGHGKYIRATNQPWSIDKAKEDVGATFFDVDGDKDFDLFVVSGGSEIERGIAQLNDRLYINLGNGKFEKAPESATPQDYINGSCVTATDFDKDGDIDLFVGGSVRPGRFPYHSPSAILRNESDLRLGKISLVVGTLEVNSDLRQIGLVTDASWADVNNDSWPDLVVVGEWMPIRIFINQSGKLIETKQQELIHSDGWWNRLFPFDLDSDGDTDFIVGNAGTNLPWQISVEKPFTVRYRDFNSDGKIDPIISTYIQDKEFPIATRDELLFQLPILKKKYNNYASYAASTMQEVITEGGIKDPNYKYIKMAQSVALLNDGTGKFQVVALPADVQISSLRSAILLNHSQKKKEGRILTIGNFYSMKTQFGRLDASLGAVLHYQRNRFWIKQKAVFDQRLDVRNAAILDDRYLLIGCNSDSIRLFIIPN